MAEFRIHDEVREFDHGKAFRDAMTKEMVNDEERSGKRKARRRANRMEPGQYRMTHGQDGFSRREPSVASMTKGRSFRAT